MPTQFRIWEPTTKMPTSQRATAAEEAAAWKTTSGGRLLGPVSCSALCERCGRPARVHVLEGYDAGQPCIHRFCLGCMQASPAVSIRLTGDRSHTPLALPLALAGLMLGVVGLFGDVLIPAVHAGFGWHQSGGVAVGILIAFVGVLIRAEVLTLGGGFLFGASLCADVFGLTRGPGIGWKQQLLIGLGAACAAAALVSHLWGCIGGTRVAGPGRPVAPRSPGA